MRWHCAIHRALIPQRSQVPLWTALDIRRAREKCRASISLRRLRNQFYYVWLVESLRAREEEESRSDNQEQDDIDGTGEVEHRNGEKRNRRRYMVVTEL